MAKIPPPRIYKQELYVKGTNYVVEAWLGASDKVLCTIYEADSYGLECDVFHCVQPHMLPMIPAKVIKALARVKEQAEASRDLPRNSPKHNAMEY